MKNEDRLFLLAQREKSRYGSMGSVDRILAGKEQRKMEQMQKENSCAQKEAERGANFHVEYSDSFLNEESKFLKNSCLLYVQKGERLQIQRAL